MSFKKKLIFYYFLFIIRNICFSSEEIDLFNAGMKFYKTQFYEQSEKTFKDFIKKYPKSEYLNHSKFFLALSQLQLNKFNDAINNFLTIYQDNNFIYRLDSIYYLALSYNNIKKYSDSEKFIDLFLNLGKDRDKIEKIIYVSIVNNINLKNYSKLLNQIKNYLDNNFQKNRIEVLKLCSNFFIENEDYENAIKILEILLYENLSNNEKINVQYNYIFSFYKLKKYREAINFFINNITGFNNDIYLIIADCYEKIQNYDQSINLYYDIFNNSKNKIYLKKIGLLYIDQNDYIKAIEVFKNIDTIESKEILANLYYKINDINNSYKIFKSLNIEKIDKNSFLIYFQILNNKNYSNDIIELYNNFNKIKNHLTNIKPIDRNNILYKIGEELFKKNYYEKAIDIFTMWLNEFFEDKELDKVLFLRGVCYKKIGEYSKSLIDFSKIQKMEKKDKLYYETLAERGEVHFLLEEYNNAIINYSIYLNNKKTDDRKKDVLLQFANANFNIRNYKEAYKSYLEYFNSYGETDFIYDRIVNSLLNLEEYQEILNFLSDKKNINDYCNYIIFFAKYKLNKYNEVILDLTLLDKYINSKYFLDILYLSLLSRFYLNNFTDIKEEYIKLTKLFQDKKYNLNKEKIEILFKEYFKIFIKNNYQKEAKEILSSISKTDKNYYFIIEVYYNNLLLKEFNDTLNELFQKNIYKNFSEKELQNLINMVFNINIEYCNILIDFYFNKFSYNTDILIKKIRILFNNKNIPELENLLNKINNQVIIEYIKILIEYLKNSNTDLFKESIIKLINQSSNNLIYKYLIGEYILFLYNNNFYKEILDILSNNIDNEKIYVTAELKYYEGDANIKLKYEENGITELLKIFYIYSYDVFWVYKSINKVLEIYKSRNDMEKYQKIIDMFEEKYFKYR